LVPKGHNGRYWIDPACDRKSRQYDRTEGAGPGVVGRQSVGRLAQVDETSHHRHRLERDVPDFETTDFQQADERRCRPYQQTAVHGRDMHPVVTDESRKR
jgi:hypothetical protein